MMEFIKIVGTIVLVIWLVLLILKYFKEIKNFILSTSIPIIVVWINIVLIGLAYLAYHYAFSQIYKFNNFIGVVGVIITMSALIFYLHKKFDILTFLKQFSGISEYDNNATNLKKFLKILQISFTIIIFSSIAIAFFSVAILSIFNPILAM